MNIDRVINNLVLLEEKRFFGLIDTKKAKAANKAAAKIINPKIREKLPFVKSDAFDEKGWKPGATAVGGAVGGAITGIPLGPMGIAGGAIGGAIGGYAGGHLGRKWIYG